MPSIEGTTSSFNFADIHGELNAMLRTLNEYQEQLEAVNDRVFGSAGKACGAGGAKADAAPVNGFAEVIRNDITALWNVIHRLGYDTGQISTLTG